MDYHTYLSPFSWRYGSADMRTIWSEAYKRHLWRFIWVALAEVQAEYGLLQPAQVVDLREHIDDIDVSRALEIEAEIHHDLMAELRTFAEQCPFGGGALHLGATSTDIEDNADVLRVRQSLDLVIRKLQVMLGLFVEKINQWSDIPIIAFTHLQPAEPSTLGYRLAQYAQDLLVDWENLRRSRTHLRGKGFKGAVGTGASYADLIGSQQLDEFETRLSAKLGLPFYPVTTQTYPRKQDYQVISPLAGLGGSLYKFAFDLRLLQSPTVGEWSEPFSEKQVGSSAMPFKRNPIRAEKIDSLARLLAQMPRVAWDNAAHSLLERTLDDSANRRTLLPESFLITDELLNVTRGLLEGLQINKDALARNLDTYAPFAATERVLMALGKAGADRQVMHERLRSLSMTAWKQVQEGGDNPLEDMLASDEQISRYIGKDDLRSLLVATGHLGNAASWARRFAMTIQDALEQTQP